MAPERAWVLNFDAEDELSHGAGYTTPRALLARFEANVARLQDLVPAGDRVLFPAPGEAPLRVPAGMSGRCWCPTPGALRRLREAGATVPAAPPAEVLRAVNGRGFCAALGQTLPGAVYARSEAEVERAVRAAAGSEAWVLKRELSYAGRGRRRVRAGAWTADDAAWVRASLAGGGGLQVEPWVARALDAGLHGFVGRDGRAWLGAATVQAVDERGQWVSSRRAGAGVLSAEEERALRGEAARVADALYAAGYFGPFGVDAFRWRDEHGREQFNPRCEVNARYSMGWAVGMEGVRPDLDEG